MANTKSAKKATRKIARRTEVNKARRSRMRSSLRHVEAAIASGDKTAALVALTAAEPSLFRAARHGVIHKKNASRKVSRLTHRIAKIGAADSVAAGSKTGATKTGAAKTGTGRTGTGRTGKTGANKAKTGA